MLNLILWRVLTVLIEQPLLEGPGPKSSFPPPLWKDRPAATRC